MNLYRRIYRFFRYDVWRRTEADLSKSKRIGYMTVKTVMLSIRGYAEDELNTRANALTYSMIFAIVPILALTLAIAKGFGFEHVIENRLYEISFLKQTNVVPIIMDFVERYLATAQGGVFLGVGILVLLWSVHTFFRNIELSFNKIWEVKKSRSYLRQFTTYITILLMIPVLIVVSSGLSIFINSTWGDSVIFQTMAPFKEFFIKVLPFILCWIIFSWMYKVIPNTIVGFWASVIPGVLIGTFFQVLQMASLYIVIFLSRTSIVYGTFAAIPLLLIWLQWSCLLILLGAEMSYAIQNNEYFEYETDMNHMSRRYKDYITLYIVYLIVKRFEWGGTPLSAREIAQANRLPIKLVNNLSSRLVEAGILREIYVENKEDKTFLPAIDIHQLTIGMVFKHIDSQGTEHFLQNIPDEMKVFWQKWQNIKDQSSDINLLLVKDIMNG